MKERPRGEGAAGVATEGNKNGLKSVMGLEREE